MSKITIFVIIALTLAYVLYKSISASVLLKNNGKVNLVFYGEESRLYSIDNEDVDYLVTFPPEAVVLVPGGYGNYRVGALNKLVQLEHQPDLFKKAFSAASSSLVDLYFYPTEATIFYKNDRENDFGSTMKETFFSKSNANLIDRFLTLINLTAQNKQSYKLIELKDNFDREKFNQEFQGIFYKKAYRREALNVQIIYTKSYKTAVLISKLLDGEGIRVVDLTQDSKAAQNCEVLTKKEKFNSVTVRALKDFFDCRLIETSPAVSDIILKLGSLEKDWEVN